jgi:hypothetical protein
MRPADAILWIHLLFVLFVVAGFVLVPAGAWLRWGWVRLFWLRAVHLGAIVFVAVETLAGVACPLTVWEDALRGRGAGGSFVQRLIHSILFYDLPDWMFASAYVAATVLALLLWKTVPPTRCR